MTLTPIRFMAPLLLATLATAPAWGQIQTGDVAKRGLTAADFPRAKQLVPGIYSYEALRAGDPGGQMTTVSLIVITNGGVLKGQLETAIRRVYDELDHKLQ